VTVSDLEAICRALRTDYERKLEGVGCSEGELIWHIPLFWFALYTGMRISELARLRWQDIDFDHKLIYIRTQKNRKEQTIPLNSKAREALTDIGREKQSHYVFTSPNGPREERRIRTWCQNVSKTFSRYRDEAEIERRVTFHGLRHGFCTLLAEAGKTAATIQAATRHEDIVISMQYVHLTNRHIRRELEDVFG
jgi:integrase